LRDAKYVASSVFAALVLSSVRSVLVLRILGPALLGAWRSATLLYTLAEFGRLGVSRGVGLRVPVLDAQGEKEEADRAAAAAGAFMWLAGGIMGLAIFVSAFFVSNPNLRTALWFVAGVVALTQPTYFLRELATARHRFKLRAIEILLESSADFVAAVSLSMIFQLRGLGAASVVSSILPVLFLSRRLGLRFRIRLDFSRVKTLIRSGLPFSLTEGAFELTRRLDVLLMVVLLGPTFVGYYGISLLIMDFSTVLAQKGVSQVLSPHMLREFGRTGSSAGVALFYEGPARLFCYLLPPLLGAGSFLIGDFVRLLLPQYVPGIPAAQVTMWAIFSVALHASISSFFVAADKIALILRCFAVLIPLGAVAQYLVLRAGLGLEGAAWTSVVVLGLTAGAELCFARRNCGHGAREIAVFLASLYFPLLTAIMLKELVESLNVGPWSGSPLESILKVFLFLLFYAPVLIAYESRFSMLRAVYQTM